MNSAALSLPLPAVAGSGACRHLLSILDLTVADFMQLCRRAIAIKYAPESPQTLRGRTVGIYFRTTSTRTRSGFEIGASRLGATAIYYGPGDLQLNTGESLDDTARVLAGFLDALVVRTNDDVGEMRALAAPGSMAVINALSADEHPTQAIVDLTTLLETFGRLEGVSVLYCGEGNKTAASLALALSRIPGARLTLATPVGYGLRPATLRAAAAQAALHGAILEQVHDLDAVGPGVDAVYTSRWQEMGVSKPDPDWRRAFLPFRVTSALMRRVGHRDTVFLHDFPAVRGDDVDDEVIDAPRSLAWVQAQHKLFAAMAVLEWATGSTPTE